MSEIREAVNTLLTHKMIYGAGVREMALIIAYDPSVEDVEFILSETSRRGQF